MKTFIITIEAIKRTEVKVEAETKEEAIIKFEVDMSHGDLGAVKFEDCWDSIKVNNIKEDNKN
jgi:hypothetical protein